jgi:hypothetical protein
MCFSYIKWEESFENSIPSDELITKENNDTKELENRIQELNYTLEDTIALELTTKEVSSLLMKSFSENDFVNVEGIYIEPIEEGYWRIHMKVSLMKKFSVWSSLDVRKDDRQTAEIYLSDIYIWRYSLKNFGIESKIESINSSITSALITVEENGFVGRSIDNIELLESRMVIKLTSY